MTVAMRARLPPGPRFGRSRIGFAATLCGLLLSGAASASTVLLDTVSGNPTAEGDSLNTVLAPFALVHVGPVDVQVGSIGVFGRLIPNAATNAAYVRWSIFGADGGRRYDSGPVRTRGSASSVWFDAPEFSAPVTLSANSDYYIGLSTDATFVTRYFYDASHPAVTIAGDGLASPGGNQAGSNGVVTNFSGPTLSSPSQVVQVGARILAPGVLPETVLPKPIPLPPAAWLFGSGLIALAATWRRAQCKPREDRT
jgi:hypothetical protein